MTNNTFRDLLGKSGFHAFLWTQFLGAFNDNVYKIIVSMRAVHVAAPPDRAANTWRSPARSSCFRSCSSPATPAMLADAVSKRTVLIAVKAFEIVVMVLGFAGVLLRRASI